MALNPMRQAAVAGALAGVFGLGALLAPADSQANMNKDQRRQIMLRTVFMLAADFEGNDLVPISRGSGTILTADGAVLTNHHVVWNEQKKKPYDVIIVGVTDKFDEKPVYRCMTYPKNGVLKEEVDLALIKCETDMDGKPWKGNDWPFAQVGSSEDLVPGDDVVVIGYPGIGGWTINYTTGKVSGFIGADGGAGTGFGGSKNGPQTQEVRNGVTVMSQVKAVDNNSPIRDALVIVLKPGVRVKEITKDNIGQKFLTKATTNSQGQFQLESPVPRDQKFSVIVVADGFEPLYEDNVLNTEGNVPDRYDPWGTITLKRE